MKSVFNPFQRYYRRDLPHACRGLLMWWRIEIPCFARDFIKVFEVVKYFYYLVFPITRRHLFLDNFSSGSRSPFRPAAITFLIYELPPAKLKILTLQSNMIVSLFPSHLAKKSEFYACSRRAGVFSETIQVGSSPPPPFHITHSIKGVALI